MKRLTSLKSLAAAAIVLGAFGASVAHARSDVFFSIGVQAPGVYVQPAPVYVRPAPVYVQPEPVYVAPRPVYVQPQYGRTWERRGPYGDRDRDGIPNMYDRDGHRHHWRHANLHGPFGDYDRDGVPNRADRFPGNPYRR